MLLTLLLAPAEAAEVVWLAPADAAVADRVGAAAGAKRGALDPLSLRAAASDWGPADDDASRRLEQALRDVRAFETRLDGELVIMADLAGPISSVRLLRGDADRSALFSALAYQGFAVDRFFEGNLARDERAAPYRTDLDGVVVETPWMDAVAIDPERQVTPYDIAEAPQRIAYGEVQAVVSKALPARVAPKDLPAGARLVVDGRPVEAAANGAISLVPGRHLAHVEKDGHVLAQWDVRLAPGERRDLEVALTDAEMEAWVATFSTGMPGPVPADLQPSVDALGGEVWVALPRAGKEPLVWKVGKSGATPVSMAPEREPRDEGGWTVAVSAGGGWLSSGDFYLQDPAVVPQTVGSVNAGSVAVGASFGRDLGPLRASVGADVLTTLGEHHVARYGADDTRFRPYPYVGFGHRYAVVTAGWAFPHHPTFGLRASVPLVGSAELQGGGWYGLGLEQQRADGTTWDALPIYAAWGGVGWRFGL